MTTIALTILILSGDPGYGYMPQLYPPRSISSQQLAANAAATKAARQLKADWITHQIQIRNGLQRFEYYNNCHPSRQGTLRTIAPYQSSLPQAEYRDLLQ